MKLATVKNDLQTNAEFESKEFGIGDASVVIEILRNRLYAHPIRTLVQEYISNGRDAIREAGNAGKLKVQAPTRFDATFKVRDYGTGISPARMSDIFVMYGSSTKRSTNNQTGGFGIGAKSAWSYTDSFTITTFVDGTKRSYVAHTGANNNGRLDLIETMATDEENGTEIQIAVKPNDVRAFRNAILRSTFFWADHEKPEITGLSAEEMNPKVDFLKISSEVEAYRDLPDFVSENQHGVHLIIDGIVYSLDNGYVNNNKELKKLANCFNYGIDTMLKIPNGVVEVSASREKIADSDKTRKALEALGERWTKQVTEYYKGHFKACQTVFDFAKVFSGFQGMLNKSSMPSNFKGFTVNHETMRHDKLLGVEVIKVSESYGRRRRRGYGAPKPASADKGLSKEETFGIPVSLFDHIYFVDTTESKVNLNKRIRVLLKMTPTVILIQTKLPEAAPVGKDGKAVDQTVLAEWSKRQPLNDKDLEWMKKELQTKNISDTAIPVETKEEKEKRVKEKGSISVHMANYYQDVRDVNLETDTRKFVYATLEYNRQELAELKSLVETEAGAELCRLSGASIKRIEDNENFTTLEEFFENLKITDKMKRSRMSQIAQHRDLVSGLVKVKKDIKAKDVLKVLEAYESLKGKEVELPTALAQKIDEEKEVKAFVELDNGFTEALKTKYPLVKHFDCASYYNRNGLGEEVAFYINAKN